MGSLITSDFSCKSTLRVEEWKMKFEDNNCVPSFKVRQFMGMPEFLHQWSTISGVVRLALQSMLILKITHNSQRVSGLKVSSRTKRMQKCASSMCPSKSSTGICSPLDELPLFSVFSQTPRKHTLMILD